MEVQSRPLIAHRRIETPSGIAAGISCLKPTANLSQTFMRKSPTEGGKAAVGSQEEHASEVTNPDELHTRATQASAIFRSVRARMHGRQSQDYPAVLEAVIKRKLSTSELDELGYKPETDPEDLIKQLWYALVFEAYFAGHPRATIRVHLLPLPETQNCYLWSKQPKS